MRGVEISPEWLLQNGGLEPQKGRAGVMSHMNKKGGTHSLQLVTLDKELCSDLMWHWSIGQQLANALRLRRDETASALGLFTFHSDAAAQELGFLAFDTAVPVAAQLMSSPLVKGTRASLRMLELAEFPDLAVFQGVLDSIYGILPMLQIGALMHDMHENSRHCPVVTCRRGKRKHSDSADVTYLARPPANRVEISLESVLARYGKDLDPQIVELFNEQKAGYAFDERDGVIIVSIPRWGESRLENLKYSEVMGLFDSTWE